MGVCGYTPPPSPDGAPVRKSKVPIRKKSALILAMLRSSRFALNFQGFHAFPRFSLTSKAPIASTLGRGRGLETGALKYAKSSLARPPKFLGHRFGGPLCRKNALRSRMSPGDFPRGCRCIRGSLWLPPPPPRWSHSAENQCFH